MGPRFAVGDQVVVLDFENIGDPHRVGCTRRMYRIVGEICTVVEVKRSMHNTTFVYSLNKLRDYVYDEIWLKAVDTDFLDSEDIDSFFSEFEVK